jgi:hypothetical protein
MSGMSDGLVGITTWGTYKDGDVEYQRWSVMTATHPHFFLEMPLEMEPFLVHIHATAVVRSMEARRTETGS